MELAQNFTPESFATYSALAAALIIPTVELLRGHVLKTLDGMYVIALSVAVGAAYGAVGSLVGYVDGSLLQAVAFGAWAGVLASGANKYVDKVTKK